MITIDAHSHYMPPEVAANTAFFKQFWSDADGHVRLMDEYHIARALLLYPTSDAHLNMGGWDKLCTVYNQGIADCVLRFPDRFIGAGIIPVDQPAKMPSQLRRIEDLGLRVISMASSYGGRYLDHDDFASVFEFAQKHRMPVHVHPQIMEPIGSERVNDPLLSPVLEYVFDVSICIGKMMMSGTFQKYPDVSFIFAHYGGVLPLVKERFDTTYTMLRGRGFVKDLGKQPGEFFKNLYFDMSGTKSPAALAAALEMADSKHILWGSDFPANKNFSASLNVISSSILSSEERENICGINFLSLIKK